MTDTASPIPRYQGEVARIRETMERERAALGLAGERLLSFDSCEASQNVLRQTLFTPPEPWLMPIRRPWRLGIAMVAPKWLWSGLGRVVNDRELDRFVVVWTRKAHRAWTRNSFMLGTIAAGILRGEIKDAW